MDLKICVKCNIQKSNSRFRKYSNGSISGTCKACLNELDKQRKKNLTKKRLETAIYKCNLCNVDKVLKEFSKLKVNYKKKVCLDCLPRFLQEQQWEVNERKSNINYRIKKSLASRLRAVLHKENTTMSYIGCPIQYLREWFEYNFNPGMTWENYGTFWDIDHIIPVQCFDLTNEKEKYLCWNWSNLNPFVKTKGVISSHSANELSLETFLNSSKKDAIEITQIQKIKEKLIKFKEEGSTTKWFSDDYMVLLQPLEIILEIYNSKKVKTI